MFSSILLLLLVCCVPQHSTGYSLLQPRVRQSTSHSSIIRDGVNKPFGSTFSHSTLNSASRIQLKVDDKIEEKEELEVKEPSAFDQVASKGLAGVLAIAAAEA
jgi:hypothetical protein